MKLKYIQIPVLILLTYFLSACGGGEEVIQTPDNDIQYGVSVALTGNGIVSSSPSGIQCGTNCSSNFAEGTSISLTATAESGYVFSGWSGDCSGTSDCNLVMNSNQSISALFQEEAITNYSLTVSIQGSGSVSSTPVGINCGTDCSEDYSDGSNITLSASPDAGFRFVAWSGACTGSGSCMVQMTQDQTVSATFEQILASDSTLTVTVSGNGSVTSSPAGINCGTDCSETYSDGSNITLSASPDEGSRFVAWGGACTGSGSCVVQMTQDQAVSATFEQIVASDSTLTVTVSGNGSVTSSPVGINCGTDCSEAYEQNTSVSLTAVADEGFKLDRWSGDCSGNISCNLDMDTDKNVTAVFVADGGQGGTLSIANMGMHEVNFGDTFTYQPQITGDVSICRKDLAHDDVKVDSETGLITWDTSSLNFGRGFYIRIKCSNFSESVFASMVVHVDKSGTSRLRIAGENNVSPYIGVAGQSMTSGDTIVFPDGEYPVSVSRNESYENAFKRTSPTDGTADQYSTIISESPGGAVINGEAQNGIGKQKNAFQLSSNNYIAIVGFVVKNVQRESFTTNGNSNKLLIHFVGAQGAGTWGRSCSNFSEASSGECSNAGMRVNGGTPLFQNSYDWGHNRYGIMTSRTNGSITRRSLVRLDEHKGDQPYGGFSDYCDTLHLSQDNVVFDSLAIAAPHYKNYAGLSAYPATGCENTPSTLKTVGLLAVNNKLSLSLMDSKAGPNHIWDHIVSYDSEGTCTPQTDRCGLWLLQADKPADVSNSFFGKARGFEGSTSISRAFGNNINFNSNVTINDVPSNSDVGVTPEYLPELLLYYRGKYDTFHGDQGYDTVTTARRWPIAGEDIIAANMRSYRNQEALKVGGGTIDINGDRGAAAAGDSMSEYFWGYINNKVPPLVVRVKDKGAINRVAWEHLTGSRRTAVTGWKVECVSSGNNLLASLSADQLVYNDDSGCQQYGVKASYAEGDSGIAYTETPE